MGERRMKMKRRKLSKEIKKKAKRMDNNEIRKVMENFSTLKKKVSFRPRNGRKNTLEGKVVKEVSVILDNNDKHFIQKIRGTDNKYYYRHCYYVWSKKSKKPVFGQFASTIPEKKYKELIRKAKDLIKKAVDKNGLNR
jgi:hypothetical protein